jgi:hypothetical protein
MFAFFSMSSKADTRLTTLQRALGFGHFNSVLLLDNWWHCRKFIGWTKQQKITIAI